MDRVSAFELAVFLHLDSLAVVYLVFHGDVITPLTFCAFKRYLESLFIFSHEMSLIKFV